MRNAGQRVARAAENGSHGAPSQWRLHHLDAGVTQPLDDRQTARLQRDLVATGGKDILRLPDISNRDADGLVADMAPTVQRYLTASLNTLKP